MATAYINSQRYGVQFQDRINKVINIDPEETPLTSMIAKTEAKDVKHIWQTMVLDTADADNAAVEGSSATLAAGDYTAPVELSNYTQIPRRTFANSFTQDQINKPGSGSGEKSGFNEEKARKTIALKLDIEKMILSNNASVQPLPESTQAGKLQGTQKWLTTNVVDATSKKYAGALLSQGMFNDLAQKCVDSGGRPKTVLVNSFNKLQINGFVGRPQRDVSDSGKKITDVVDTIESIAGVQEIVFDRHLTATVLLMLELQYWALAWLRAPQSYILGLTGSKTEAFVEAELTLEAQAEKSSGKITGLKTA